MPARPLTRLRFAFLGACTCALVLASIGGATDNSALVVGQTNSATKQTALQGTMATPVFLITNFSTASGAYGLSVNGNSNSTPAIGGGNGGSGIGFRGLSVGGIGALGIHTSTAGTAPGAQGETNSTADYAVGVLGRVNSSSPGAGSAAVHGQNNGTGFNGVGVWGSHAGLGTGVYGTGGIGVSGISPSGTGVYGESSSGYAGFFAGDVYISGDLGVNGTLSKTAGMFKIDHPLHPASEYLQHSFVESPDMLDVYNGNVVTDSKGFATVSLPRWFQALNRSFRYQLTIVGTRGWNARVVKEIAHNRFTIQTDESKVKVSWQVTGIRRDPYANAHRIKVVVPKTGADEGKYLHPELYGQPKSKGIDAETLRLHRERVLPAK
jgi:hypothetical protein